MKTVSILPTLLCCAAMAQEPATPDYAKLADVFAPPGELPSFQAIVPENVQAWAGSVVAQLGQEELDAIWLDGLRDSVVCQAVAIALLTEDTETIVASPQLLSRALGACAWLGGRARKLRARRRVAGSAPADWLADAFGDLETMHAMCSAELLRRHSGSVEANRLLILPRMAEVVGEAELLVAVERLGERIRGVDRIALARRYLRKADFAAAVAQLDAFATSVQPVRLDARDALVKEVPRLRRRIALARTLQQDAARSPDDAVAQLRLQAILGRAGVLAEAERLVAAGTGSALPHSLLAMRALENRDAASVKKHVEAARKYEDRDGRVGFLLVMAGGEQQQKKLLESSDAEAEASQWLFEAAKCFENESGEVADLFRMLQLTGWPKVSNLDMLARFTALTAEGKIEPERSAPFQLMLAGCLLGEREDAQVALSKPVAADLLQRPLLMRQLATVATMVALDLERAGFWKRAEAIQSRQLDTFEDAAWIGYLRALRAWSAARSREDRVKVAERLVALQTPLASRRDWAVASSPFVIQTMLGMRIEGAGFAEHRPFSAEGAAGVALLPVALAMLVGSDVGSGMKLARQLEKEDLRPIERLLLLSVQAVAMDRAGEVERAAALARKALAADIWEDLSARLAMRGVLLRNRFSWQFGMRNLQTEAKAMFDCVPLLVPPMPSRGVLKAIVAKDQG